MPSKAQKERQQQHLREATALLDLDPKYWPNFGRFKIIEDTPDSQGAIYDEVWSSLPKARAAARRFRNEYNYLGDWYVFNYLGECVYHIAD